MRYLPENIKAMAKKLGIQFPTTLPLFFSPPNIEYLTDWAESQITLIARKIAYKMVENLQYIAFEDFLKQLQKTINKFHEMINDDPYVLLIGELSPDKLAEGCSDQWIAGLALEYCGLKAPAAILTPNQLKSWQCSARTTVTNILMLDDAAYSGEQKNRILKYFCDRRNEIQSDTLSFYVGIPFMTRYAEHTLTAMRSIFKKLIVLEHVSMLSTADILDSADMFYAKQVNIGFISHRQTVTYFDHRFADFFSCFQQIYNGSNLLSSDSVHMMHFLGYTFDLDRAQKNKNLCFMHEPKQYNKLAISFTDPNHENNCSGYTIPTIIPPYQLHQYERKHDLARVIEAGTIGQRSPYLVNDPEIVAILAKPVVQNNRFFHFKKSILSLEKQKEYDKAVMLGNHNEITYEEHVNRHKNYQQVQHELKTCFPILKPLKTESRHPLLQCLMDTLVPIFNLCMSVTGLRMVLAMFQEVVYCNPYPDSTNRLN